MTWSVTVQVSRDESGAHHVYAVSDGDNKDDSLAAVQFVKDNFVRGRLTAMRVEPEAESERDFDTKLTRHRGFVRFTFFDVPGECLPPKADFAPIPLSYA